MSQRLLAREQSHQARAFELYCSLGEKRSYEQVAAEFSVSLSTVKLWGKSFNWKQRVRDRDIQIARELASRTLSDEVNHRERNLKIVRMSLVRIAKAIVDGDVKMTLGDLDKLIDEAETVQPGPADLGPKHLTDVGNSRRLVHS